MGSRKEELLEMLKSTLALSKTSLRVALKKPQQESSPAATSQCQSGSKKDSQPAFSNAGSSSERGLFKASVEEEDDFLYGKTGAGVDRCSSSDAGHRFQKQGGEPVERYRDHTSQRDKSLADMRGGRFDNPREFAQNAHASSGPGQSGQYKGTSSAQSNSFFETDRFSPAYGSDKSSVDSSFDTSKMVDNILKSISIDEDLSKIIAEKLKKSCEDAAAAVNNQNIAEQNASMIPVRIDSNARSQCVAEVGRFTVEYPSPERMQSTNYHHHPADAVFPGNQSVPQESRNSNWNRKTEEFLRKLEVPQPSSGSYEERNYENDRKNFDQRKRLSTGSRSSLTKSPSPVKKFKVQQNNRAEDFIDSARRVDEDMFASSFASESSRNKPPRVADESRRIVMKPEASNSDRDDRVRTSRGSGGGLENTGINKEDILETINALEEEIRKLEKRRSVMSLKALTPQLQASLNTNVQMQFEMKNQISTMRQIVSEISSPVRGYTTRDEVLIRDDSSSASAGDAWDKQVVKDNQAKKMADTKGNERLSVASTSSQRSVGNSRNGPEKFRDGRSPTKPVKEMSRQRSRSRSRPSDRTRNEKKPMPPTSSSAGINSSLKGEKSNIQIKKEAVIVVGSENQVGKDKAKEPNKMIEDRVKMGIEYAVSLYMKAQRFYDCGNLWCQHCDRICSNVYELCGHLHTQDHLTKSGDIDDKVSETKSQGQSCGPNSAPARGEEFIKPVKAFYCTLCEEFCKDDAILEAHFTSVAHNKKFQEFLVKDPDYEVPYLAKKMAVILKENTLQKESKTSTNQTAPIEPSPVRTEQVVENRKVIATKKSDIVPLENISITLLRKEPIKQNDGKETGSGKQANSSEYRSVVQGNRDQASMNLPRTYHVQPFKLVAPKK